MSRTTNQMTAEGRDLKGKKHPKGRELTPRRTSQGAAAQHWQDLVLTRPKTASRPGCVPDTFAL